MIDFSVTTQRLGDRCCVVELAGEVDLSTAPAFERALEAAIGAGPAQVVIDLTSTTYIDSSFLNVVAGGHKRLNGSGRRLSIACSDPNLVRVLQISGFDRILTVEATLRGALLRHVRRPAASDSPLDRHTNGALSGVEQ